jgi:hypothetical protein
MGLVEGFGSIEQREWVDKTLIPRPTGIFSAAKLTEQKMTETNTIKEEKYFIFFILNRETVGVLFFKINPMRFYNEFFSQPPVNFWIRISK